jgi:LysM repeat protein
VESGHTLSAIAVAYGSTVKAIKEANQLSSDNIYIGQKLFIPE